MMAVNAAPPPPGAGPTGPGGGGADGEPDRGSVTGGAAGEEAGLDPIFQGREEAERPTKRATLLFQFFLFPLLIVVAAVGVFLFFGLLGGSRRTAQEYLDEVMQGGENVQKQAAHQLAVLIARERREERDARAAGKEFTPFYAAPDFRAKLLRAFEDSFPERTDERKAFLAAALGAVGDPAFVAPLVAHLKTAEGDEESEAVRSAVARALADLRVPQAVAPLETLSRDRDDYVANVAVQGLSRLEGEAATAALRAAASDTRLDVRLNAAAALALRGDATGLPELERTLDGSSEAHRPAPADSRQAAIANAIRGVAALRVERLRPKVAAFLEDGDPAIRALARDVLDRWEAPK
jgi:HEAT repeat protein